MAPKYMAVALMLLLVAALEISTTFAVQGSTGRGRQLLDKINCADACDGRCKLAGVKDRCLNYCNICCRDCNCVPSGTYGNKDECPCYRDKLNDKKKSKCP